MLRKAAILGALVWVPVVCAQDATGNWQGTLALGASKLRIGLHVSRNDAGLYSSTLDSIDQGAMGMPVRVTTVKGAEVYFELPDLDAVFDGTINADGTEIAGLFNQRGATLMLTFSRVERVETVSRPQEPKPPFPYESEDVTFENKSAGVKLAGTLTRPRGEGPFAAAILISGSGPQDRDETIFGHKPFWVIADYLTRRGVAVLRTDDRGVGGSSGNSAQSSLDDVASDVGAAIDFLKSRKEIDGNKIGLIGHSEGAMVAVIVASQAASRPSGVAWIVMLAGAGVTGEQVLYKQAELIALAAGASPEAIKQQRSWQETVFRILKTEPDNKAAVQKMQAAWDRTILTLPAAQRAEAQSAKGVMDAQIAGTVTAEFRGILAHDPAPLLRKIKVPVLALGGSGDLQVSAEQNLPAIAASLAAGGNEDYTVSSLPGLNHLFQTCTVCIPTEYATIDETFSPKALELIGDWIPRH
ncbi:MAG TPA: alpha/beta fold hydrolase [Bryobacteraceae bacterium]|nr:alpha/beta fold hydrolase [Bryobacteraceae bacterium]